MIEAVRIVIPDLFAGVWDASVVSTYGADLHFFERDLLRQMDRIGNRVVLADNTQVNRSFSRGPQALQLHQVNRTYLLAPIRIAQAAHVKFIMMLNGVQGLLAVGSGNLSMSGYASQGEIFTIYHYTGDNEEFLPAFMAVKEYLDGLGSNGNIDSVAREQLQMMWVKVPWMHKATTTIHSPVRHNMSRTFLDQLVEQLGGRVVDELVVHAPFYDRECRALERLLSRTNPRRLVLLVQERVTSVDASKLEDVIASSGVDVDLRSVSTSESGVMIHAKFIIAKCGLRAVCLQGSPNMSTVAMSMHQPQGNLEMASLLEGHREAFDHLIFGLNMSGESVNLAAMDLRLVESESDEERKLGGDIVRELSWAAPVVSGRFASVVLQTPTVIVGDEIAADVEWRLEEPIGGETSFRILLGEKSATAISRNCAIVFGFSDDSFTVPTFPYHRKSLAALHSVQLVTDLLTHAADFDVEDEELERLLRQLDDVLVVDSRSLWRIIEGPSAITPDDDTEDGPHYEYSDIDWTAILNHPKMTQYRNWGAGESASPTSLAIILSSIAQKFREEVERKRLGFGVVGVADAADWWSVEDNPDSAENEQEAETAVAVRARRGASARSRAQRMYLSFLKRFVNGITDESFLERVGPSVIVPGYIIFNNICWRLIQRDLADPMVVIERQEAIWDFIWGSGDSPGYVNSLSDEEQIAVLELLDRHHSEAVLMCSFIEAYEALRRNGDQTALSELRERWRRVLTNPLWQPSRTSLDDAATLAWVSKRTRAELVDALKELATFNTDTDHFRVIEEAVGAKPGTVFTDRVKVRRGLRDVVIPQFVIYDPDAVVSQSVAIRVLEALGGIGPSTPGDYVRIKQEGTKIIVLADYAAKDFLYISPSSEEPIVLSEPILHLPPWQEELDRLQRLAG